MPAKFFFSITIYNPASYFIFPPSDYIPFSVYPVFNHTTTQKPASYPASADFSFRFLATTTSRPFSCEYSQVESIRI